MASALLLFCLKGLHGVSKAACRAVMARFNGGGQLHCASASSPVYE
jgi:hypothetical protein